MGPALKKAYEGFRAEVFAESDLWIKTLNYRSELSKQQLGLVPLSFILLFSPLT